MTDKSVDQLLNNLRSVQMAVISIGDDNEEAVTALFDGAVDMILQHPASEKIIASILLGMTREIGDVTRQLHTTLQAIDRADAFVLIIVGQLLALIEQNNIDLATESQQQAVKLSRWIVDLIAADLNDENVAEKAKQMDELFDLYEQLDGEANPDALRKIIDNE